MLAWVLFFARGTSAGSAVSEPGEFVTTLLDGLTSAGLYFVVAAGFTLIFGLMRTVNMAHGSLFLLAAYIAIEVQQRMVGKKRNIAPEDVDMLSWIVPLLVGAAIAAVVGFVIYEVFLRWNQGQELRQALITLAISVILADQMLARAGGLAQSMAWPRPSPTTSRSSASATPPAGCSSWPSPSSSAPCCGCGSTGPAWAS